MNHEFCMNCGHKNLFEVSRPKFCAGCGEALNTSVTASQSVTPTPRRGSEVADEETDLSTIDINKLRASVKIQDSNFGGVKRVNLNELWDDPAPSNGGSNRPKFKGPSGMKLLNQNIIECRTNESKDIEE